MKDLERDDLIEALGMGISRRTMLKRMGYGMAGAALAPSLISGAQGGRGPIASLASSKPQPIWDYKPPTSYQFTDNPVFYNGTIIIPALDSTSGKALLYGLDVQTKEVRWAHVQSGDIQFFRPLVANNTVYAADYSGKLYAINPSTGNILWQLNDYHVSAELTLADGKIIFPTAAGHIYAFDLQGNLVWYYPGTTDAGEGASSAVVTNGTVVVMMENTLYAVDLQTGTERWTYITDVGSTPDLSAGNGNVYFRNQTEQLVAVDVSTGQLKWKWSSAGNPINTAPAYYNGAVYAGDLAGNFYAVGADNGTLLWQFKPAQGEINSIAVDDGIAYFAAGSTAISTLFAVDLASQGQEVVSFNASDSAAIFGIETGVCYYINNGIGISAVNLAGLVHQFFCESELMVEDYTGDTNNYQGNTTSFRTHVQLFDPNKNPRINKSVKVWASEAMTITSGGQSYDVDTAVTGKSAWLQTDGLGELSIVSTASSISSPALYLWGNFMEVDEAIVIYPDHDTLSKLSSVQSDDLSQTNALAYDGTPLLPPSFNAQQISDLASTIRYTTGGAVAAMQLTREKHRKERAKKRRTKRRWSLGATTNTYIAFPESTFNLLYQPVAGPSDRAYVPGEVTNWTTCFDANGGVTFNCGTTELPASPVGGFLSLSFDDFVNDIVKGADKIKHIAWDATKDAVATITSDIDKVYHLTIDALEKAADVVAGILKTVVGDIKKAIQWLSYLFNWDDILKTKDQLKGVVQQGFTNLKTWADNQIQNDISAVQQFFQNIENSVSTSLEQATTAIGGNSSLQTKQQNGNNPQAAYGAGGAKSYTKSRWMTSKVKDNASQSSIDPAAFLISAGTDPLISALQQLVTDIGNTLSNSPQFNSIPADIKKVFTDFSLLVTKPSDFVTHSFSDIITLIKDLIVTVLQVTAAVVESLLRALQSIIDLVIEMVNKTIKIPIISDLYSLITHGSPLTILDLCCLGVAIPTTIVSKAINSLTEAGSAHAPGVSVVLTQNIGFVFALGFYAILDPLIDVFSAPLPLKFVYMGLSAIIQGLNFPVDLASNTAGEYLFYAATAFPLVMTGVDITNSFSGADAAFKELWDGIAPVINTFYGFIMVGASLALGVTNTKFQGKDYLVMIQNVFSFIPFIFKPLGIGDEEATPNKLALGVIDGVCDLTVLGLVVAEWEV